MALLLGGLLLAYSYAAMIVISAVMLKKIIFEGSLHHLLELPLLTCLLLGLKQCTFGSVSLHTSLRLVLHLQAAAIGTWVL